MNGCRISRVRLKAGGADVRVLRGSDYGEMARKCIDYSRTIVEQKRRDLVGFIVIGWASDGSYSMGCHLAQDSPCTIPRALLPSWVSEVIRRDIVTRQEVRDVLSEEYIVEPPLPPSS